MNSYMLEIPTNVWGALETICGRYGNGTDRKKNLSKAGLNPDTVQSCVNELLKLFEKYGD